MRIEVTGDDITCGQRGSLCWCPIARAAQRVTGAPLVRVTTRNIHIWFNGRSLSQTFTLPKAAKEFILAFDDGDPVEPFTFDLEHTCESQ